MITVLRMGHRVGRDDRISTHCGLVARALGADEIVYTGDPDSSMIRNIEDVTKRFGGSFSARYAKNWKHVIGEYKQKKFSIVHLTVYGQPVQSKIKSLRKKTNLLIIIGGEKVPAELYKLVDQNISITQQPHSEVSALAVFLHEYFSGKELEKKFKNARLKIVPQDKGKKVEQN